MPASACLRIGLDLSDEKLAKLDALGPSVARMTNAFLESRWQWPKTFSVDSPFCFTLNDPKASEMDAVAVESLAEELQLRLFGTSDAGSVTLLLLEADQANTEAFKRMSHAEIRDTFKAPIKQTPFAGRLLAFNSKAGSLTGMKWRNLERERESGALNTAEPEARGLDAELRGIYFTPRQFFIGSSVAPAHIGEAAEFSLVDGADKLPREQAEAFDKDALQAALRCLEAGPFTGVLYLPICFSSLMRRSTREFYEELLRALPTSRRNQLAASVYDVPRAPSFWALTQTREILSGRFSSIDLHVEDVGFEIENLPPGAFGSVTYRLPDGEERLRLNAIRQFMKQQETFKRHRVWPAITNVATSAELRQCLLERTPFITGRAVCGPMLQPVGSRPCGIEALPFKIAA